MVCASFCCMQDAASKPSKSPAAATPSAGTKGGGTGGWTAAEEKALRAAAAALSESTPSRWQKIADKVGGNKTKDACKKHFKEMNK